MIQNLCRMQERCVFGRICSTACLGERAILFIQSLYPNDTCPEARRNRNKCADLRKVRHQAVCRSPVHRCCKNLGFSWPVHSSLASSAKLHIVKAEKTQMVEISWEPSDTRGQQSALEFLICIHDCFVL